MTKIRFLNKTGNLHLAGFFIPYFLTYPQILVDGERSFTYNINIEKSCADYSRSIIKNNSSNYMSQNQFLKILERDLQDINKVIDICKV